MRVIRGKPHETSVCQDEKPKKLNHDTATWLCVLCVDVPFDEVFDDYDAIIGLVILLQRKVILTLRKYDVVLLIVCSVVLLIGQEFDSLIIAKGKATRILVLNADHVSVQRAGRVVEIQVLIRVVLAHRVILRGIDVSLVSMAHSMLLLIVVVKIMLATFVHELVLQRRLDGLLLLIADVILVHFLRLLYSIQHVFELQQQKVE